MLVDKCIGELCLYCVSAVVPYCLLLMILMGSSVCALLETLMETRLRLIVVLIKYRFLFVEVDRGGEPPCSWSLSTSAQGHGMNTEGERKEID